MTTTKDSTPISIETAIDETSSITETPHKNLLNSIEAIDRLKEIIDPIRFDQTNLKVSIKESGMCRRDDAIAAHNQASDDLDKINSNLEALEQQINECQQCVNIERVIEHQAAIDTVQAEINNYQQLIEDQQQIITIASQQPDLTSELIAQREELLTEIALGGNKASALKKLDTQLDTIKTEQAVTLASNSKTIEQANQTISGLNRRVTSTQEKLFYLQSFTPKMLDILLMEQASLAAIEFNAMAEVMREKLTTLAAIDLLIIEQGQRKQTGLFNGGWQLSLPIIGKLTPQTFLNSPLFIMNHSVDGVNQLKQCLLNQGIKLNQIGG